MYKHLFQARREDVFSLLLSALSHREATPEDPYWLCDDAGESYCLDCIKAKKADFDYHDDYGEFFDGGFSCEEDGSECCEQCGKLLDYTLTDYGVNSELDHYKGERFDWGNSDECYMVARMANGAYSPRQKMSALRVLLRGKGCPILVLRDTPIPVCQINRESSNG